MKIVAAFGDLFYGYHNGRKTILKDNGKIVFTEGLEAKAVIKIDDKSKFDYDNYKATDLHGNKSARFYEISKTILPGPKSFTGIYCVSEQTPFECNHIFYSHRFIEDSLFRRQQENVSLNAARQPLLLSVPVTPDGVAKEVYIIHTIIEGRHYFDRRSFELLISFDLGEDNDLFKSIYKHYKIPKDKYIQVIQPVDGLELIEYSEIQRFLKLTGNIEFFTKMRLWEYDMKFRRNKRVYGRYFWSYLKEIDRIVQANPVEFTEEKEIERLKTIPVYSETKAFRVHFSFADHNTKEFKITVYNDIFKPTEENTIVAYPDGTPGESYDGYVDLVAKEVYINGDPHHKFLEDMKSKYYGIYLRIAYYKFFKGLTTHKIGRTAPIRCIRSNGSRKVSSMDLVLRFSVMDESDIEDNDFIFEEAYVDLFSFLRNYMYHLPEISKALVDNVIPSLRDYCDNIPKLYDYTKLYASATDTTLCSQACIKVKDAIKFLVGLSNNSSFTKTPVWYSNVNLLTTTFPETTEKVFKQNERRN